MTDELAFIKNRLRAKPVNYTVEIGHFVANGEWSMSVAVNDIGPMDEENRRRIASDLRRAADLLEDPE